MPQKMQLKVLLSDAEKVVTIPDGGLFLDVSSIQMFDANGAAVTDAGVVVTVGVSADGLSYQSKVASSNASLGGFEFKRIKLSVSGRTTASTVVVDVKVCSISEAMTSDSYKSRLVGLFTSAPYTVDTLPDPATLGAGATVVVDGLPSITDESNVIPVSPSRFRFKRKPSPSKYIGMAIITDIGDPYSVWFSDGMNWKPYAGSLVIEQAHQSGNAMTGSGAGGTSDLGFGLSSTYTVFPLGKQFDLLAGIIGNHGSVRVKAKFTATNNANTHEVGLGSGLKYTTAVFISSSSGSAWDTKILDITISNRGSETSKTVTTRVTTINAGAVTESVASSTSTLDTSIDQKLWFYGCLRGNSSDAITLESFSVELLRA